MQGLPKIDPQKEAQRIIGFIKETVRRENFSRVVVSCSGGVDSSLTLYLATLALGRDNVLAVKLPYFSQPVVLANLAIGFAQVLPENIFEINIGQAAKAIVNNLPVKEKNWKLRQGNVLARSRMIYLYDLAKVKNVLVCGTENKSEYVLGYFTRFGDESADLNPISHLYKTYVNSLARYLKLPEEILKGTPSAELWPGQTDEEELGFSYLEADPILFLYWDKKLKKEAIIKRGFAKELVEKVLSRVEANRFKHQIPYNLLPHFGKIDN